MRKFPNNVLGSMHTRGKCISLTLWRNRLNSLSYPSSSCCLNIWLKVQSSWQRFIVHSKYLQYNNIHTVVQVHMYSAVFSVQIPIPKCSKCFSCNCYLLVIRVYVPHCYWMPTCTGHVWIPHWWMQHGSDKFDLCLVINCKVCLDALFDLFGRL